MTPSYRSLPFYPTYKTEVRGHVTIWWFVKEFSQSRYNFLKTPISSNACTIISVLLASRFYYNKIEIVSELKCELIKDVIYTFAKCILDGNEIHGKLRESGTLENINLTIPEAIQGVGHDVRNIVEWKSELYVERMDLSLYNNIKQHLIEWFSSEIYKEHPDLYIILIADQRSVLLAYQDNLDLITLFDSHQHLEYGALVAQVPRNRLKALCYWFSFMIVEYFNSQPECYELSFLYFKKQS